ncbi:MAG: 50S ribosomal protein L17 [Chitinophagales bacterium]|nr:50S ribosomal protein L17 [Chitinophagales bacterium]
MRHGDKVNNLGRTAAHRHALLSNLAVSLIKHKRIFTTVAKAKSLRVFVEPIITRSKEDTTHNRRVAYSYLGANSAAKQAVKELFGVIGSKVADRPGGYTRIIKAGFRAGDGADMALIELVDFNEIYTQNKTKRSTEQRKKTRRGPSKKKAPKTAEETNTVSE